MSINFTLMHTRSFYFLCLLSFVGTFFIASSSSADVTTATPAPYDISLIIGDQTEIVSSEQMNGWFTVQNKLSIDTNYRSEIENTNFCPIQQILCVFLLSQKTRYSLHNQPAFLPKIDAIQTYVDTLNTKVAKAPVDAKFTLTDGKISVFALSQNGLRLDIDKSVSLITDSLSSAISKRPVTITLPIVTLKPTVQSSDADTFGIAELIGEGRTNFAGSPKNRIHNFTRALEQFNGVMLASQEEFSFVKFLGEVDGAHGYLPELVIKQNRTEPEFGGGICQVSSTVFRAAIYSGLKITARRNHAYPVSYYKPYGMDATVYIPKPDLRFINNTPGHILIESTIEGSELIFRFYGTSDGRKTEVDGPHILEHNSDGSMKTVFTQKVTDAQGNIVINDDFRSNYASPSKFPHPGQTPLFTEKPKDWSRDQWSAYKQAHNL